MAAGALALAGCAVAVENPPAYDAERDLCAAKRSKEWDGMVERCREAYESDAECGGVISFTGKLEGEAVTVDSALGNSEITDRVTLDGVDVRQEVKLYGRSPYFAFELALRGIGGELADEDAERALSFGGGDGRLVEPLDDDVVRGAFRMSVGGETKAFALRRGSLAIARQSIDEQVATFTADLPADGDHLTGCFHAFAVKRIIVRDTAADAGL